MTEAGSRTVRRPRPSAFALAAVLAGVCIAGPPTILAMAGNGLPAGFGQVVQRKLDAGTPLGTPLSSGELAPASLVRHVDDDAGCSGLTPCYGSIGAAVTAAVSGDEIRIAAGRYPESVVVTDKALKFEGPGADDAGLAAVWAPPVGSAYALLVDALSADITETHVSGLRFEGGTVGIHVGGRRPGGALGPPPGRPGGSVSTDIGMVHVLNSRFEAQSDAAVIVRWVEDARLEEIQVADSGVDAVRLVDGGRFSLVGSSLNGPGTCVRVIETRPAASRGNVPLIGGTVDRSNDFSGCAGAALELENQSGDPTQTNDVAAAFNRWGVAWEPEIEERILDTLDVPNVGRVRWRPAIDAPSDIALLVTPTLLVADGVSRAVVDVQVNDGAGQPVQDGVVVALTADAGTLVQSGTRAEAEGAAVVQTGEWGVFNSPTFGPFEGGGYLRSDQVGASLSWSFSSPALVGRFGTQPIDEAIVQVQVDDGPAESVGLFGAELRWIEHLLASGLGPGSHVVTLTVVAGTVAVDSFGAGWPAEGGVVRTDLVAPTETGFANLNAHAWGAGGRVNAARRVTLIPGPPSAMNVTLGSTTLAAGGATTDVVVTASDALGRPMRDGTPVTISATLGSVEPAVMLFRSGEARATFTSGDVLGDALVTAEALGVSGPISATAGLEIVPGPPALIALEIDKESMAANSRDSARVAVRLSDLLGNPVRDGTPVRLTTSLGGLEGFAGVTAGGTVTAVLRAGAVAGVAKVEASSSVGTAPVASEDVELFPLDLWVTKRVEPAGVVVPGEVVTFTVAYGNRGPGTIYDVVIDELMPEGIVSPSLSISGPTIGVRPGPPYIFDIERIRSGRTGEIQVRGRIDQARVWKRTTLMNTVRISAPTAAEATPEDNMSSATLTVEPSAVYTVTLGAPAELSVGGATGQLRVRVFDRFGNDAADGTPVSLATDLGSIEPTLITTEDGRASATFSTGTESGVATVSAISLEDRGDLARILIEPGPAHDMVLSSSHERLPVDGGRAELVAAISDQYGNPVSDTLVIFSTDLGSVAPGAASTSQLGIVTSTLVSGVRSGTAVVESRVGTLAKGLRIPFDPGPPARLRVLPLARALELGRSTEVLARLSDEFDNPIAGAEISFAFDRGVVTPASATTGADGTAKTAARPTSGGSGRILALSDALDAALDVVVQQPTIYTPYLVKLGGR